MQPISTLIKFMFFDFQESKIIRDVAGTTRSEINVIKQEQTND